VIRSARPAVFVLNASWARWDDTQGENRKILEPNLNRPNRVLLFEIATTLSKTIGEARRLKTKFFRAARKILVELTRSLTLSAFVKNGSWNFD
jgi:hypothetical protein